jgi:hypothetical protein
MAREAGAIHIHGKPKEFAIVGNDNIKAFEAFVRADERSLEREALLDLVDAYAKNNTDLKAAIRERSANAGARGDLS